MISYQKHVRLMIIIMQQNLVNYNSPMLAADNGRFLAQITHVRIHKA